MIDKDETTTTLQFFLLLGAISIIISSVSAFTLP